MRTGCEARRELRKEVGYGKGLSLVWFGLYGDLARTGFDNRLSESQSDADAFGARIGGLVKALKNMFQIVGGHAGATISDLDAQKKRAIFDLE